MPHYTDEEEVRQALAALARAGAAVTYYLRQPSYSRDDIANVQQAVHEQAFLLRKFLGSKEVNRITVHQSFHMPSAIIDYGEQLQQLRTYKRALQVDFRHELRHTYLGLGKTVYLPQIYIRIYRIYVYTPYIPYMHGGCHAGKGTKAYELQHRVEYCMIGYRVCAVCTQTVVIHQE